jgi:signal transduction histidine kinase
VTYTNLPPGKYLLKIKASDLTTLRSSAIRELEIIIIPAWWQTLWFRLALVFTALIAALAIHLLRTRYLVAQRKKLQDLVEIRTHKLNIANTSLKAHIEEIDLINKLLSSQKQEIHDKNNEILTQNEELVAQNEQIVEQRGSLIDAQHKLKEINAQLEQTVEERTKTLQLTIADLNKTVFELDRFVYSASHDLSAPLKSIRGLVEIINLEKDASNLHQYVEYINSTVLKLESVIKNMTDYSRNTHVLISKDKFSPRMLVEEVLGELAFIPETSKIKFDNNIPESLIILNDRPRIKVILHNLIGNAIKYVDKMKDASWVKIECERMDTHWKIRITDNGIGIRKEHLDRIFNMYFRATELSKGSGLGLFIVKETLDKMGGDINVKSKYGEYTTFEMSIPDITDGNEQKDS